MTGLAESDVDVMACEHVSEVNLAAADGVSTNFFIARSIRKQYEQTDERFPRPAVRW